MIRWDDKDHAHTACLINWCTTNPDDHIKLFSDSHLDVVKEGRSRQQMSSQKETLFRQVAVAIFTNGHDPLVRESYVRYPASFSKLIKSRFQT